MSRLADRRYSDPAWEEFREHLDAWMTVGGWPALEAAFDIKSPKTLDRWRLGISTPSVRRRQWIITYIRQAARRE